MGFFTICGWYFSGNTASDASSGSGGGVYVASGSFTMSGGKISGNTALASVASTGLGFGGGVCVAASGSFTMSGGELSGNTASNTSNASDGYGGGVFVSSGSFSKTGGGTIYGSNEAGIDEKGNSLKNTVKSDTYGHAVYYYPNSSNQYYRDLTLDDTPAGNISTKGTLPSGSGQTLNNWTKK
jgi:hypothetical protein